jgi:hypothetical protein
MATSNEARKLLRFHGEVRPQPSTDWDGSTGALLDDWDDDWIVVADEGGDPFIFVRSTGHILHAWHGEGAWNVIELFPDLNAMAACLGQLGGIDRRTIGWTEAATPSTRLPDAQRGVCIPTFVVARSAGRA